MVGICPSQWSLVLLLKVNMFIYVNWQHNVSPCGNLLDFVLAGDLATERGEDHALLVERRAEVAHRRHRHHVLVPLLLRPANNRGQIQGY